MNKVFVVGAGFSKALAGAPLASELFEKIYQKAQIRDDDDRPQRELDRRNFNTVVNYLQQEAKPLLDYLKRDGTKVKTCDSVPDLFPINIEYLCTILDLNIKCPFIPQGIGADLKGCPIPYMHGLMVDHLCGARQFIQHYIVQLLLPEQLSPKTELLDKFVSLIEAHDTVVTFNYDILIEQVLWRHGIWNPVDGYGIGKIHRHEEVDCSNFNVSDVTVVKLHGSINWRTPSWFGNEIEICTTHPLTNAPLFHALNAKSKRPIPRWKYAFNTHVVLPTFLKTARHSWELYMIRLASRALAEANEIFFLGYSFPEADAIANFIFAQARVDAQIRIIDSGEPRELANRLIESYGVINENVIYEKNSIENWIANDFKYTAYERELERQRDMKELLGDIVHPR
ncbi:MAG: SIR2 family protein [candidate division KSB1 bacterium]